MNKHTLMIFCNKKWKNENRSEFMRGKRRIVFALTKTWRKNKKKKIDTKYIIGLWRSRWIDANSHIFIIHFFLSFYMLDKTVWRENSFNHLRYYYNPSEGINGMPELILTRPYPINTSSRSKTTAKFWPFNK